MRDYKTTKELYDMGELLSYLNKIAYKKWARLNLKYANFNNANLKYANFYNADLEYANFNNANLKYAKFNSADLKYANFNNANLKYAELYNAKFNNAKFNNANLEYADLEKADLENTNLENTNLENTNLENTKNKIIIRLDGIGSAKRSTIYNATDNQINCGCFYGDMSEFIKKIKDTYMKGSRFYNEYKRAVKYLFWQGRYIAKCEKKI